MKLIKNINNLGFTMVEVMISVLVILVLVPAVYLLINPVELQQRARDKKRISDVSVLERAITEYSLDNKSFPDNEDTTRYSNVLPSGNSGPLVDSSANGWIDANLVNYMVKIPIDPINDATNRYIYRHSVTGFEINVALEYYLDMMKSDGGNNSSAYEIGNDLSIL